MKTNIVTKLLNALKFFVLVAVLSFGVSYAATWVGAPANPPAGNAPKPINISADAQVKAGALTIGTALSPQTLSVFGTMSGTADICTGISGGRCLSNANATSTSYVGQPFLIRAAHTSTDCTAAGGTTHEIDAAKYVCRLPSLIAGWTQYPSNWTTTQNVYCVDPTPIGWTTSPCNTGSHTFSNTPTESCISTSTGTIVVCDYRNSWYDCFNDPATTSTTCYATVIERGAY
ncbi:MAG: hypothetical protein AAB770_00565 [Patescibacteria group bacterium]